MSKINRRNFIKTGGLVVIGVSLLPGCATNQKGLVHYRFFTPDEAACIIAMCEQFIPGNKEYGGATDAGVIFYIDRQLAGYFKDHTATYRESIQKLQAYCYKEFGKPVQNLPPVRHLEIMEMMERNKINKEVWEKPSDFFRLVQQHTMQGFYGSPIHGGNKDYMSFTMLRLDYPLNIGQNRYTKPLHNS